MIEIKALTKKFGNFTALDNINFSAESGEIITLLGPNGAGKSTLMKCICGYWKPDVGNVFIDNVNLGENLLSSLKKIGYMPENTPLYGDMKVYEYLQFVAGIFSLSNKEFEQNLKTVVDKLELSAVLKQKISTLSKGFRRRVGVAGVILHKPQILILDEPTEGLDPNQKISLRCFLKEYAKKNNATVLISTHLLEETEALSSRVLMLCRGRLIKDAMIEQLKREAPNGDLGLLFHNLTSAEIENVQQPL